MKFSNSGLLKEGGSDLNKSIRFFLDDKFSSLHHVSENVYLSNNRDAIQLYIDKISHYKKYIDGIESGDISSDDPIPHYGQGVTDLDGAIFLYSFLFEAMIWFINTNMKPKGKENEKTH